MITIYHRSFCKRQKQPLVRPMVAFESAVSSESVEMSGETEILLAVWVNTHLMVARLEVPSKKQWPRS